MPASKRKRRDQDTSSKQKAKEDKKGKGDGKQEAVNSESEEEYEVDFIEGHHVSKNGESIQFFVRWKNYGPEDNTWESFDYFAHDAPEYAQKYFSKIFSTFKVPFKTEDFAEVAKQLKLTQKEEEKKPQKEVL